MLPADELIGKSIKYKYKSGKTSDEENNSEADAEAEADDFDENKPDGELLRVFSNYGVHSSDEEIFDSKQQNKATLTSKYCVAPSKCVPSKEDTKKGRILLEFSLITKPYGA